MDEKQARRIADMIADGVDIQSVARACAVTEDEVWAAMATVAALDFPPGTRVRVRGNPVPLTMRSHRGTVTGPGQYGGYVMVHLDKPAQYHQADGRNEEITDSTEMTDNLQILSKPDDATRA